MASTPTSPRSLLIDDGSLAGLAAVALSERPEHVILWHPVTDQPGAARREAMAREHASIFRVETFVEARVMGCPGDGTGIADAAMILAAAQAAHERQCRRIVWPLHVGEQFDNLSRAYEMVLILCQMIDLALSEGEHDPFESTLETPFLDLTDAQLVEVASKGHGRSGPHAGASRSVRSRVTPVTDVNAGPGHSRTPTSRSRQSSPRRIERRCSRQRRRRV